jgi:predicted metal-binding membrane protein
MSLQNITPAERLIGKDRIITIAGLATLSLLSWVWVLAGAGTGMNTFSISTFQFPPPVMDGTTMAWSFSYAALMLAMWWIMMIAMMIPSAAPMILLYGRVARHAQRKGQMEEGVLPTFVFVLGYLAAWFGFSALATGAQWGLERAGLVHQMLMWSTSTTLTALLLIAAGLYQLTPLKRACLEHCRSPASYLSAHWRGGRSGAFEMGLTHGTYCLGCCWVLMALLFAGGVMNLVWIAGLTIIVLTEKVIPWGARFGQGLAALMVGGGVWLLLQGAA